MAFSPVFVRPPTWVRLDVDLASACGVSRVSNIRHSAAFRQAFEALKAAGEVTSESEVLDTSAGRTGGTYLHPRFHAALTAVADQLRRNRQPASAQEPVSRESSGGIVVSDGETPFPDAATSIAAVLVTTKKRTATAAGMTMNDALATVMADHEQRCHQLETFAKLPLLASKADALKERRARIEKHTQEQLLALLDKTLFDD